ncbi:hypothetical protein ACIA5C_32885 [Actinoplanes sp. NPDC051343]|uniref:hypothetical protein n=1 Tax=Actinoplanes sp. NPDC051343 TaxID=3363906 RepID=UPI00378A87F7
MRVPFVASQAATDGAHHQHRQQHGRAGRLPGFSLYEMSKTALIGLTKALGRELGPRATTASPGPTGTTPIRLPRPTRR